MTKIEAYIRSHLLSKVQESLEGHDVHGMSVIDVRGMGRSKAQTHTFRGSQYGLTLSPRVKVEVLVRDEQVEEVVQAILEAAQTGEVGDGKIFTVPLGDVVRIRTGERGDAALS